MERNKKPTGTIRKVAVYFRISVEEERSEYEQQVQAYRNLIDSTKGCRLVRIYSDSEISDMNFKGLPGFQQMLEDCRAGKIDLILTKSLTRFAGDMKETLEIIKTLNSLPHPVEVKFEAEKADTSDPGMRFLFHLMLREAEHETKNKSQQEESLALRFRFKDR